MHLTGSSYGELSFRAPHKTSYYMPGETFSFSCLGTLREGYVLKILKVAFIFVFK